MTSESNLLLNIYRQKWEHALKFRPFQPISAWKNDFGIERFNERLQTKERSSIRKTDRICEFLKFLW